MKYILNEKQIDNLLKPYWDQNFDGAEFGGTKMLNNEPWIGLIKHFPHETILLLGIPENRETYNIWYSNGQYFNGGWDIFNLDIGQFNSSMFRYVRDKYNITVGHIM